MGLETSSTITGLNALWPLGTDPRSEGDNHLRLIKSVLQAVFADDASSLTFKVPGLKVAKTASTVQEEIYSGATLRGTVVWGAGSDTTANVTFRAHDSTGTQKAALAIFDGTVAARSATTGRRFQLQNVAGVLRMDLVNTEGDGTRIRNYNASGVMVRELHLSDGGNVIWHGAILEMNQPRAAVDVVRYLWGAGTQGWRDYYINSNQSLVFQWSGDNYASVRSLLVLESSTRNVVNPEGNFQASGIGKGFEAAAAGALASFYGSATDGATLVGANAEIGTWWGFGVRCKNDGVLRWVLDSRTGYTTQTGRVTFSSGSFVEVDGNIKFTGGMLTAFGNALGDALAARAGFNNQSSVSAVGFPIGTMLMMYTNGVQVFRGALTNPCLSSADSIYYRLQGQPSAGTRLDGNWRACGHIDSNWVAVQRVG